MITLIHGDNNELSRNEFNALKHATKSAEVIDGKLTDETLLTQALTSGSLFGDKKTVFIDNLFGKLGRKTKLIESLATIIQGCDCDVVLWEDKEVGATVIKSLGKAEIKLFKLPVLIFQFLDRPNLRAYQKLIETQAPELVHAMLVRRIRQLIQLTDGVMPEGVSGWQASRLTGQAKSLTMNRLLSMYKKLLEMEYSVKNGFSPFTLKELTEQFLYDNNS